MIDTQSLIKNLYIANPDAVLFDNMDVALVGVAHVGVFGPVAVYSKSKMYEKLRQDGLSEDDAEEYYVGKYVATWAGENTPVVINDVSAEQK